MQSYVLSPGHVPKCFFTDPTLEAVQEAIANAGVFYVASNFDLWTEFCGGYAETFLSRYCSLYSSFLSESRQSLENHYTNINKSNWLARAQQNVSASVTVSSDVSGPVKGKGVSQRVEVTGKSSPNKEAPTSSNPQRKIKKKPKKRKESNDEDPDVFHKLEKL